jgi:type IV secretory pathway TrbF-like protein
VSVEIASVIQQTKTSWQVDWTETERDRQAYPASGENARARHDPRCAAQLGHHGGTN